MYHLAIANYAIAYMLAKKFPKAMKQNKNKKF